MPTKVAIIGYGNIGTDLMIKVLQTSESLEAAALVGIDPDSDGLARAARMGVPATHEGLDGLLKMPHFDEIEIVFDATSAKAHARHDEVLRRHGKQIVDLTPAAAGPYVVPVVNMEEHFGAPNLSMVSCGGQATMRTRKSPDSFSPDAIFAYRVATCSPRRRLYSSLYSIGSRGVPPRFFTSSQRRIIW